MICSIPVKLTEMNGTVLPALEINRVSKSYGALKAVRNVSFSVPRGEFFGLLGPNGAGKTTLINSLAGLCRIDQGFIKVMGHDVKKKLPISPTRSGSGSTRVGIRSFFYGT